MFGSTDHSKQIVVGEPGERRATRTTRIKEPQEPGNFDDQRTTRTRERENYGNWEIISIYNSYCGVDVTSVVRFLH